MHRGSLPWALLTAAGSALAACGGDEGAASKPCDAACRDDVALRGVRETLKLVYNLTLQGNPPGAQDETTRCPAGGSARVFGEATSNPVQGATDVVLTYQLTACAYQRRDDDPDETYDLVISGSVLQEGAIVVQPSSSSALLMESDDLTITGTVYDPPLPFEATACHLEVAQNGDDVSGTLCGRPAGVEL